MKKIGLLLAIVLLFSGCVGDNEKEDFTPYPGGEGTEFSPK